MLFLKLYIENRQNDQEELNQVQTYSYYKFVPMAKHRTENGKRTCLTLIIKEVCLFIMILLNFNSLLQQQIGTELSPLDLFKKFHVRGHGQVTRQRNACVYLLLNFHNIPDLFA